MSTLYEMTSGGHPSKVMVSTNLSASRNLPFSQ
uniref:Uncharacterized protein n=1 Tax=Arundo donax TaxID=35708 RepID=A0A0A9HC97_ARUDO